MAVDKTSVISVMVLLLLLTFTFLPAELCTATQRAILSFFAPQGDMLHIAPMVVKFGVGEWTAKFCPHWCRGCEKKIMIWVKKCMEYEVEDARPRGRPKKTWREIVEKDDKASGLNREDAVDCSRWRKQIGMIDDHGECEWVNVSSGTGSPRLSRTKSTEP